MVNFIQMTEVNFKKYKTSMVENYAKDNIKLGKWTPEEALELAEKSIDQLLPAGVETSNHYLYLIQKQESGEKIGGIWFGNVDPEHPENAYICDLMIYPEYRQQGYGRQVMAKLDQILREMNYTKVSLHVFGHNQAAINLYEQMGYQKTNIYMGKRLE